MIPRAVALDLGSTAIKAGVLDDSGNIDRLRSVPAPPLSGAGGTREGDAEAYAAAALELLRSVCEGLPAGLPLGLATQRSTFVLFDRASGRAQGPMVSWQDTRAAGWCARHAAWGAEIVERTGLPLAAYYAGAKLAAMQESDGELRARLHGGELLFGTLDSYVARLWSTTREHRTDLTVASRTLLVDLATGSWSPGLCDRFDVPVDVLPTIRPTAGHASPLAAGPVLQAGVSDQAAGALVALGDATGACLVTMGTGTFVLRPLGDPRKRLPGYLTAPLLGAADRCAARWALEGTINGSGPALERHARGPTELPGTDPAPDAFCVPDGAGLGAPHWRPEIRDRWSPGAAALDPGARRRVVLEGLVFRVREIVEGLHEGRLPERVLVAGGATRDPALPQALAAVLERQIETLVLREATLSGAARLAAGGSAHGPTPSAVHRPGRAGAYLPAKFARWRSWLAALLDEPR